MEGGRLKGGRLIEVPLHFTFLILFYFKTFLANIKILQQAFPFK